MRHREGRRGGEPLAFTFSRRAPLAPLGSRVAATLERGLALRLENWQDPGMKSFLGVIFLLVAVASLKAQTGRILTPEMVKNYWLNTFPQPEKLDRDYHDKKRRFENLKHSIRNGDLDDEATKAALKNNVAVHTAAGDTAKAEAARSELAKLEAAIAERERLTALRELTEEVKRLRASMESLRSSGLIE